MENFTNKELEPAWVANVHLKVLNEIMDIYQHKDKIVYFGRYRDDSFMILNKEATTTHIDEFFAIANNHHPLLKFTFEVSDKEMIFLDTIVYKGSRFFETGILDIKSYTKPTNTHQYLHRDSMHNPSVFGGFIKGQAIRHNRNNSSKSTLNPMILKFKTHLQNRGYSDHEINKNCNAALSISRQELLRFEPKQSKTIPLVFVTKYHFALQGLNKALRKHFKKLRKNARCKDIFTKQPMVAYSRHRNLKDCLTNSRI